MYARRATTSYERERIRLPSFNRKIIYTCFDRPSCVQRCLSSSSSIDALSVNGAVCRVRRTVRCYYADRRSVLYSVFEIFPTVFFGGGEQRNITDDKSRKLPPLHFIHSARQVPITNNYGTILRVLLNDKRI